MAQDVDSSPLQHPLATRHANPLAPPFPQTNADDLAFAAPHDPMATMGPDDYAGIVYRDVPITTIPQWDITSIRRALDDHSVGLFNLPGQLCDSIAADERVQATLGSRTAGVFGQPARHTGSSPEVNRAWRENWRLVGSQTSMAQAMRLAVLMGFFVAEIIWDTTTTPWTQRLKPWHPQFIFYRWDIRRYVAITMDGMETIEPGNGKWFLYAPHGEYRGWIHGVIRAIADKWWIKTLAWRDWARYNERHGIPIIKAHVPIGGDPKPKATFKTGLANLGQESVLMCPSGIEGQSYDATLLEAMDQAWESFRATIDRCDMAIVLPILWQNLTTEVKEGSFAAAREHGDIRQAALRFDESTLSDAVYHQLARPFAIVNYGNAELAPRTHWRIKPLEDRLGESTILGNVARAVAMFTSAGIGIDDVVALADHYGVKLGSVSTVSPTKSFGTGGEEKQNA